MTKPNPENKIKRLPSTRKAWIDQFKKHLWKRTNRKRT